MQVKKLIQRSDEWRGSVLVLHRFMRVNPQADLYIIPEKVVGFAIFFSAFSDNFESKTLSGFGSGQFDLDAVFSSLHATQGQPLLDLI